VLSHDEVVRRIGSCRNVLRLNVAEHSSTEDSSGADSSDNGPEMYVGGRLVNNGGLRPRPMPLGAVQQQVPMGLEVGPEGSGFVSRQKYVRRIRSGRAAERRHRAHILDSDRRMGVKSNHDRLDLHRCNESPTSGMMRRRRTKHTVITREARMGFPRSPERRPLTHHGDGCSYNVCDDSEEDDDFSLSSSELQVSAILKPKLAKLQKHWFLFLKLGPVGFWGFIGFLVFL